MTRKKFKCPVHGCGLPATLVRFAGEEIIVPFGMRLEDLKRKPPFGDVGRNFMVICPTHGRKYVVERGHHVTIPIRKLAKKPKKTP
jgi:hypothetical protein